MQPSIAPMAATGAKGNPAVRASAFAAVAAVTVSVDVAYPFTLAGLNAQVTLAGRPEQERETDCANPLTTLMVTIVASEAPAETYITGDAREMEKSGGGRLMM